MDTCDAGRRYSGYDEYEGIFGALGSARTASRGSTRSLSSKYGRDTAVRLDARGFPSGRRAPTSTRRIGGSLSTNGYERRERYLSERASKRRLKPVDGDGLDEEGDDTLTEKSRPSQQQIWLPTKNFTFRQRAGKLDTRTIARLDLQKIVATTDVETIQRHLENLAFSDVTLEDVQQYSDAYFLKLFQIAQLTLEYLLNVQDSLASHCENLETQCGGLTDECQSLETENHKVESDILALKKEIRQKQSTLATFEVMLLNATASKRAAHELRSMHQQKLDQENDPAVLNILGASPAADETGAVPLVSSCVLCGKTFISPEYLVRHQHKQHSDPSHHHKKKKKKKRESDASASEGSSQSGSETATTKKSRHHTTAPLPAEVVQALKDRNELSKQLLDLQSQLQREKEKRADDAKQAEHQQTQLATQLTCYMAKLQDTLADMEKKQEQSKHEMMRYTQEALERGHAKETQKKSKAGRLESDDENTDREKERTKATSPEEIEKRILDSLLRAQAEIHQKNSELEQANRRLQTRLRRKTRQLQCDPPPTTDLLTMAAMDAQRFGLDRGLDLDDKLRPKPKPIVVVEDKPVQTDDEQEKKKTVTLSQQVQTDSASLETLSKPEPKPIVRQLSPPVTRAEPKLPTVSTPRQEPPKAITKPTPKPVTPPVAAVELFPPAAPKAPVAVVPTEEPKAESKLQHAAHVVGKVALGFLTRRTLQNPSNWLVTLPRALLSHALSESELSHLVQSQGGELQDVTVEIEDDMIANDLRLAFAEELSGIREEKDSNAMDYHRILLHHRSTGREISGDQFIHHLRNQLDVEIIPSFEAAKMHVDDVLRFHDDRSNHLHEIRRASMDLAPGDLALSPLVRDHADAEEMVNRAATRVQSIFRRFLAMRTVEMIKIDRLVEARLVAMRSLVSSPRSRSLSLARSQRRVMRSSSVIAIHEELADENTVTEQAERIHTRLADLVKEKTGVDTRTKSLKWSRGQLSTEDYDRHVEAIEQNRTTLAPEIQQRITEISERVDRLLEETYDPLVAKHEEETYVAASRIQLAVQVAVARKKLKQLLGRKEETVTKHEPQVTVEADKQSERSDEDEKASDDEELEKKSDEIEQKDDAAEPLDTEELDDVDIKRLADAYEQVPEANAPVVLTKPEPEHKSVPAEAKPTPTPTPEVKPTIEAKPQLPPRAGTPPPSQEELLGRSPRPTTGSSTHVISPFSTTPLLSRRAAVTRRGSGYDNAR